MIEEKHFYTSRCDCCGVVNTAEFADAKRGEANKAPIGWVVVYVDLSELERDGEPRNYNSISGRMWLTFCELCKVTIKEETSDVTRPLTQTKKSILSNIWRRSPK